MKLINKLFVVSLLVGSSLSPQLLFADNSGFCSNSKLVSKLADIPLSVSPGVLDRGKVAFTYRLPGHDSDIYLIDFSNSSVRAIATSDKDDEFPVFSPDGKQIAFYSDVSGDREIYVLNLDSCELRQLTFSPGIDEDPDWSPDGKRIVFRSERAKGSNLFVMNADGSDTRQLTTGSKKRSVPRWSPDGKLILYSTNAHWPGWDLETLDVESGKIEVRTKGIRTFCHAAWHPTGASFSYSHGGGSRINTYEMSLTGAETKLTDYQGKDYDAIWRDNFSLIFSRELTAGKDDYNLFLLEVDTKKVRQLTNGQGSLRDASWFAK